jgi:phosphatidate cytidylyltransferase
MVDLLEGNINLISLIAANLYRTFLIFFTNVKVLGFIMFNIYATLAIFAAIFGDFFESFLKRCANVKDSGSVIPGHGGLLDRV